MSRLRNLFILVVGIVLLKDILVKIPGWIVSGIDTIGHMPAKMVAIILLIIAGILVLLRR